MDYLTRAKYDHKALQMMLDVQEEILARLAKARGVNLLHLEDILRFWQEFFRREHLQAEEEFLFIALRRLEHPALTELAAEHEELCLSLEKLVAIAGKLRAGKPNSGREFLETGKSFARLLERHLNKENSIFAELTVKEYTGAGFSGPLSPEDRSRLTRLFSILNNLAGEYLGREYETVWLQVEERKEPSANMEGTGENPAGKEGAGEENQVEKEKAEAEKPAELEGAGEGNTANREKEDISVKAGEIPPANLEEATGRIPGETPAKAAGGTPADSARAGEEAPGG